MPASHVNRTLAIVHRLAEGYTLKLPDGVLAMGEDMSIGYAVALSETGIWEISPLAILDLAALDALLTRHGIGYPLAVMEMPSRLGNRSFLFAVQDEVSREEK